MKVSVFASFILAVCTSVTTGFAQDKPAPAASDAAEVAKKLANPVASLISVPLQNNTDVGIGTYNGSRNTLNIQPVIPIGLGKKINLITRIILPVISQHNVTGPNTHQNGLGDALLSEFFSPGVPENGLIWGVGPVFLVPTATSKLLGSEKFGVGPTALILKQTHGWTLGALANQVWSVAGDEQRADVNQLFLQPFITYNWKSGAGLGINGEITQNWEGNTTTAFINPIISGITKLGKQIVSLAVGPRIAVAAPDASKADFGVRAVLTFVFPK
jgi:hypothetical protein